MEAAHRRRPGANRWISASQLPSRRAGQTTSVGPAAGPALAPVQVQRDQGDRLAQAHVVGQAGAEARATVSSAARSGRGAGSRAASARSPAGGVERLAGRRASSRSRTFSRVAPTTTCCVDVVRRPGRPRSARRPAPAPGLTVRTSRLRRACGRSPGRRPSSCRAAGGSGVAARGELVHLLLGQRVAVQGELPVEGEQRVRAEQPVVQRLLARCRRGAAVEHRRGGQVAAQAARPQHVDAARGQRRDAVVEQADQLVGVEGDLVGDPQLEQPVERPARPRPRRAARCWRGCGPGRRTRGRRGPDSVHSSAASQTCSGFCSSWTWSTSRTAPATSSSSSASTRSEIRTSWGRSSVAAERCRASRAWSRSLNRRVTPVGAGPAGRGPRRARAPGAVRGIASATASSTCADHALGGRLVGAVASARARASSTIRRSSSASSGATRQWRPSPAGSNAAATSRSPSSAAPASSPTDGWRSPGVRLGQHRQRRPDRQHDRAPLVGELDARPGAVARQETAGPVPGRSSCTRPLAPGRSTGRRFPTEKVPAPMHRRAMDPSAARPTPRRSTGTTTCSGRPRDAASAYDFDRLDVGAGGTPTHTDLPRLRRGWGGRASSGRSTSRPRLAGEDAVTATLEQVDGVRRLIDAVRRPAGAGDARPTRSRPRGRDGRIASLLGAEGGHSIDCSLGTLRMLFALGVPLPDAHPQRQHAVGRLGHRRPGAWAGSSAFGVRGRRAR